MKLFCKFKNSVFPIEVGSDDRIGDLKKTIKDEKKNELASIDADKLTLLHVYETSKTRGVADDEDLSEMLKLFSKARSQIDVEKVKIPPGKIPGWEWSSGEVSAKVMNPTYKLKRYMLTEDTEEGCVDILVILQLAPAIDIQWENATLLRKIHSYDPNNPLFELDTDYLANSGLPSSKLILYCRDTFHAQFKFLRKKVLDSSCLGWILGPPGTGKSTTSLAFVSVIPTFVDKWVVTWIHLSRSLYPVCVRFDGESKKSCFIEDTNIDKLRGILDEVDGKHIVFVDGYVLAGDKHIDVQKCCYNWRGQDIVNRRLVMVCSMSSRGKTKLEEDQMIGIEEFFLDEYISAAQNPYFFENIKQFLDSSVTLEVPLSPSEYVTSKFYFAGGSSRLMFQFNTASVISFLNDSVSAVHDVLSYLKATMGDRSDNVINRLFSCYMNNDRKQNAIISKFAATLLAVKEGPELIVNLARATHQDGNPSMDGWLLELWFFASLRNGGVKVYDTDEHIFTWTQTDLKIFDSSKIPVIPDSRTWWKPIKWNQGGYDAFFTDKEQKLLTFIQITSSDTHSFKIEYFYALLAALSRSVNTFEINALDIVFLVDKRKLSNFVIGEVTGEGLLSAFTGWKKGKEKDN
ncbi:hypothetical protein HK096_004456, partial [Nowakowskiella sp. JEL0078]